MRRFDAFQSNLELLARAGEQDLANEFIQGGIIDKFVVQFELSWKMLKDLMRYEGRSEGASGSPREIIKAAFQILDCIDEEVWLHMLQERNTVMHVYDGEQIGELVAKILDTYIPAFQSLSQGILERYGDELKLIP